MVQHCPGIRHRGGLCDLHWYANRWCCNLCVKAVILPCISLNACECHPNLLKHPVAITLIRIPGADTRAVMNASTPQSKMGLFDLELNDFSKVLCVLTVGLAFTLTALKVHLPLLSLFLCRAILPASTLMVV